MLIKETGEICDGFYVVGSPTTPVYLLDGPEPVLFDGGFTALANIYEAGIKEILGNRKPVYLFLTHSHFDHIGAVSHFKDIWPELLIGGSAQCGKVLEKPGAVQLISALNIEAAEGLKKMGSKPIYGKTFQVFDIDIIVKPEQRIKLPPYLTIQAYNTPGHTWDFMSYWIPEKKILIASEAVGCYESDRYIQPEFLIDFDVYIDSLKRLEKLGARILCAGHRAVFTDADAEEHIRTSLEAAYGFLNMVEKFLIQEKGDIDRTVSWVKAAEWDERPLPKQPEHAYMLNTRQRVEKIWERMNKNRDKRLLEIDI